VGAHCEPRATSRNEARAGREPARIRAAATRHRRSLVAQADRRVETRRAARGNDAGGDAHRHQNEEGEADVVNLGHGAQADDRSRSHPNQKIILAPKRRDAKIEVPPVRSFGSYLASLRLGAIPFLAWHACDARMFSSVYDLADLADLVAAVAESNRG
jgi:hypothetical protein